jgi:ABC-type Fe3+ transport system permease subunit
MIEPYTPPGSEPDLRGTDATVRQRRKFWFRAIWISLAVVVIPPVLGLAGTVIGMIRAFSTLAEYGEGDPEALAGDIATAMLSTAWALLISALGLLALIAVLVRFFTLPKPPAGGVDGPQGHENPARGQGAPRRGPGNGG